MPRTQKTPETAGRPSRAACSSHSRASRTIPRACASVRRLERSGCGTPRRVGSSDSPGSGSPSPAPATDVIGSGLGRRPVTSRSGARISTIALTRPLSCDQSSCPGGVSSKPGVRTPADMARSARLRVSKIPWKCRSSRSLVWLAGTETRSRASDSVSARAVLNSAVPAAAMTAATATRKARCSSRMRKM